MVESTKYFLRLAAVTPPKKSQKLNKRRKINAVQKKYAKAEVPESERLQVN